MLANLYGIDTDAHVIIKTTQQIQSYEQHDEYHQKIPFIIYYCGDRYQSQ
jgi:hypothetical protein